jgi:hypothetical protein
MRRLIPLAVPVDGERVLKAAWIVSGRGLPRSARDGVMVRVGVGNGARSVSWHGTFDSTAGGLEPLQPQRITGRSDLAASIPDGSSVVVEAVSRGNVPADPDLMVQALIGSSRPVPAALGSAPDAPRRTLASVGGWAAGTGLGDQVVTCAVRFEDERLPRVLNIVTALSEVVSSSLETAIYSYDVPAWTLKDERALRIRMHGDYLNNTGANRTLTLRVTLGGSDVYLDANTTGPSASRRPFWLDLNLAANAGTDAQTLGGAVLFGTTGGASVGIGDFGTDEIQAAAPLFGTAIRSTEIVQTLAVTVQHDASSASCSFRSYFASLELL